MSTRARKGRGAWAWLWLLPLGALGGWALFSDDLSGWFGSDTTEEIGTAPVRRGPLRISVTERGNLTAKNSISMKSEVEGRTTILTLIEEGTRVQAGDLIAELDTAELVDRRVSQEISVQNAEAAYIKARESYEIQKIENESTVARAEQEKQFAENDLDKYLEGDWPQQLQQADEDILLAEEELKRAEERLKWSRTLAEKGFVTRTELEGDELAHNRSRILLEQRKRQKELLQRYEHPQRKAELQGLVEETERELRKARLQAASQLVDAETAMKTSEARLDLEREKLAKYVTQIERARIVAPVDGMVVYGRTEGSRWGGGEPVQEGGEVRERQEIASIPGTGGMIAEASIHESVVKQVEEGQECFLRIDALPGREYRGSVQRVAVLPDRNSFWANPNLRLYKTEIAIEGEAAGMRPGMSCSIEILIEELENVLYVPLQAVNHVGGRNVVFVSRRGQVEERDVEVGPHNEKWVALREGVEEGELVLLSPPPGFLTDQEAEDQAPGRGGPPAEGEEGGSGGPMASGEGGGFGGDPGGGASADRRGGGEWGGAEAGAERGGYARQGGGADGAGSPRGERGGGGGRPDGATHGGEGRGGGGSGGDDGARGEWSGGERGGRQGGPRGGGERGGGETPAAGEGA